MDNFKILGLNSGATKLEIKAKFKKLSLLHHPDKGGDTSKFIQIREAYEELMKESPKDVSQETATYRFEKIYKEGENHIVRYYLKGVFSVMIYGKNGLKIAEYSLKGQDRIHNLEILKKDIEKAEYILKIRLFDRRGNYGEDTWKIKPPLKGYKKLLNKYFNVKY